MPVRIPPYSFGNALNHMYGPGYGLQEYFSAGISRFAGTALRAFPMYAAGGMLREGLNSVGIPTTLYDIGEKIGFTDFGKREKRAKLRGPIRKRSGFRKYRVKSVYMK